MPNDVSHRNRADGPSLACLEVAYKRLTHLLDLGIEQFSRNGSWSGAKEVCRAIELFVHELYLAPAWWAEVERRSALIEERCKPGTVYAHAKAKALKSYSGRPRILSGSKLAICRLRTGNANPHNLRAVVRERDYLETILDERVLGFNADAADDFRQWLAECRKIQKEAERLQVDGCWYLYHVDRAVSEDPAVSQDPADASYWARKEVEKLNMGGVLLPDIRAAAKSLFKWVRENPAPQAAPRDSLPAAGKDVSCGQRNDDQPPGRQTDKSSTPPSAEPLSEVETGVTCPTVDLDQEEQRIQDDSKVVTKEAAVWLGGRAFRVGGKEFTVNKTEAEVLEAAIRIGRPFNGKELEDISGVPDAGRTFRHLAQGDTALAPFVHCPGSKSGGGYRADITDGCQS